MPTETAFSVWLPVLRTAFFFFLWTVPAGLTFFAANQLTRHVASQAAMPLRLIRQIAPLAVALEILRLLSIAWLWLLPALSAAASAAAPDPAAPGIAAPLEPGLVLAGEALLSLLLFGLAVSAATRKSMAGTLFAACLGGLANLLLLLGLTALWGAPLSSPALLDPALPAAAPLLPQSLADLAARPASAWLFWAWLVLLAPAAGIGLAQLRVLGRRAKDDFGRDYYAFALRACAKTASLSALFAAVLGGVAVMLAVADFAGSAAQREAGLPPHVLWGAAGVLFCLIAAGLWFAVRRSATPLRHKVSLLLTPLLLFAGMFCLCAV